MVYLSEFDMGLGSGECDADERCEAMVAATSTPDIWPPTTSILPPDPSAFLRRPCRSRY
jgi:hypothetical protein